jgi:hypothetical protein
MIHLTPDTGASCEFTGIPTHSAYRMNKHTGVVHRMTPLKCQKVNIVCVFWNAP